MRASGLCLLVLLVGACGESHRRGVLELDSGRVRLDAAVDGAVPATDAPPTRPPDSGADDTGLLGSGACTNASDSAASARHDYGPAMDQTLDEVAAEEGRGCALEGATGDDLQRCTRDRTVETTGTAVSAECADCYAGHVRCAFESCLAECIADPNGAPCVSCRCGMNPAGLSCVGMFSECSGVPSDECAGL